VRFCLTLGHCHAAAVGSQVATVTMVMMGTSSIQQAWVRSMDPSGPLVTQWGRDCTLADRRYSSRES
jgi:hypothetical protein